MICADAGYPGFVSRAGREGVDLLLLPSLDWAGLYRAVTPGMALRSIENGMTILRVTGRGQSAVIDPFGVETHIHNSFAQKPEPFECKNQGLFDPVAGKLGVCHRHTHVMFDVPVRGHRWTLYPHLHDIHAVICCIVTFALVTCKIFRGSTKMKNI